MSDFPSEKNPQPCKNGCNTKIYLSDKKEKGRWLPYELDGTIHDCPNKPNGNGKQPKQEAATHYTLEMVQRKLESIGIIINVERLMKE